jgi:hypothetical protein
VQHSNKTSTTKYTEDCVMYGSTSFFSFYFCGVLVAHRFFFLFLWGTYCTSFFSFFFLWGTCCTSFFSFFFLWTMCNKYPTKIKRKNDVQQVPHKNKKKKTMCNKYPIKIKRNNDVRIMNFLPSASTWFHRFSLFWWGSYCTSFFLFILVGYLLHIVFSFYKRKNDVQ